MDLGIAIFATDRTWAIDELARAAEDLGFASLAVPEHTHIPLDHSEHPAGQGLPDEYRRTLDPTVALTVAATVTTRLRLVYGALLLAQHDPIVAAKAIATLDHVSDGRVEVGVGYGWNRPELAQHGVAWTERRDVVRDRVAALRALWTQEEATLDAEHASFAPTWSWPKPVQPGGPPVLLGAALGPRTLDALATSFDGWMPLGRTATLRGLEDVRAAFAAAGRDRAPRVHVVGAAPDADALAELAAAGVDQVTLWLPSAGRDEVRPVLERYAGLLTEVA